MPCSLWYQLILITFISPCHSLQYHTLVFTKSEDTVVAKCIFFNWDSLHARLNSHHKSYKIKQQKKVKHTGNLCRTNLQLKDVKGKQSTGREFQTLAVRRKKLLTQTFLQHLGMVTEKSCDRRGNSWASSDEHLPK